MFIGILVVAILCLIAAVIFSSMAAKAAKDKSCKDPKATNYATYSAVVISMAVITIGIVLFFYFFTSSECPVPPKDNTLELVDAATKALNVHAIKLQEHAKIINASFNKVNNVSESLSKTCDDTSRTCPSSNINRPNLNFGGGGFKFEQPVQNIVKAPVQNETPDFERELRRQERRMRREGRL